MNDVLALAKLVCKNWDTVNLATTVRELSAAIDRYEAEHWRECVNDWKAAEAAIESIRMRLLLNMNIAEGKALEAAERALDAIKGQAYMFSPQSEWRGGPSDDPANFCYRKPHIAS